MYKIIHLITYINIIRNELYADLFNIFIGGTILHFLAFFLTGCGYTRGVNDSASGSAGYLISNITFFIISFIVLYVISCIVVNKSFDKNIF